MSTPIVTAEHPHGRCGVAEELIALHLGRDVVVPITDPRWCEKCRQQSAEASVANLTASVGCLAAEALRVEGDEPGRRQILAATRVARGGRASRPLQGTDAPLRGPGTELKTALAGLGWPACGGCHDLASEMNRMGPSGCRANLDDLVGRVQAHAQARLAESPRWADRMLARAPDALTQGFLRLLIGDAIEAAEAQQPRRLAVVTALFNPRGDVRLRNNWRAWRDALQPLLDSGELAAVVTAEALWGDQTPQTDATGPLLLRAGPQHLLWQKERLLNLAIGSLPADLDAVAWIDADVLFERPDWPAATREALGAWDTVQLFDRCEQIGEDGNVGLTFPAMAAQRSGHAWPGYAWAALRSALPNGLYDEDITGSADLRMFGGWTGRIEPWLTKATSVAQRESFARWNTGQKPIGAVAGTVRHLWHGPLSERQYHQRQRLTVTYDFDPAKDIAVDESGLWRWTGANPALESAVAKRLSPEAAA